MHGLGQASWDSMFNGFLLWMLYHDIKAPTASCAQLACPIQVSVFSAGAQHIVAHTIVFLLMRARFVGVLIPTWKG